MTLRLLVTISTLMGFGVFGAKSRSSANSCGRRGSYTREPLCTKSIVGAKAGSALHLLASMSSFKNALAFFRCQGASEMVAAVFEYSRTVCSDKVRRARQDRGALEAKSMCSAAGVNTMGCWLKRVECMNCLTIKMTSSGSSLSWKACE